MASARDVDAMDVDRPAVKDVASASTAVSSATAAAQDGSSSAAAGLSKRFESARDRVSKDKYDVDAWQAMLAEVERKSIVVARPIYEQFLKVFPTSARHWRMYFEHELSAISSNMSNANVEKLLKRCLRSTPNVDLWRRYLRYVMDTNVALPNAHATILAAFELAVSAVGYDINATPLWQDYILYVQSYNTEGDPKAESIKLDTLRKIYQRSVVLPIHNLEALWREYTTYENNRDKKLATGLLSDLGPKYMDARAACRERKNHLEGIQRSALALPPNGNKKDLAQVQLWKKLVEFEKRNVQGVDSAQLRDRVLFTFNQALLVLNRYPEIWFDLANYELSVGGYAAALKVYERATIACEGSLLLRFAHADLLETHNLLEESKAIYEELMRNRPAPIVFVTYMRFARRAYGAEEARRVFFIARKSPQVSAEVYIAAAEIEFAHNKDTATALKIYEIGMSKYSGDLAFMMSYVDLLEHLNNDINIRAVFEQMLTTLSSDDLAEVWARYLEFEKMHGSLSSILSVEERLHRSTLVSTLPQPGEDKPASWAPKEGGEPAVGSVYTLLQRHHYRDLWPCSLVELNSLVGDITTLDSGKAKRVNRSEDRKRSAHALPFGQRKNPLRDNFDKPDLGNLPPFKMESFLGVDLVLPASISNFLNELPKLAWEGHTVDSEIVLDILRNGPLKVPEAREDDGGSKRGTKRKADSLGGDAFAADDDVLGEAPKHDVFRSRQSAKLAKLGEDTTAS